MDGESSGKAAGSSGKAKRAMPQGRPFRKGASGNPRGRRPVPADVKAILLAGDEAAARRLVQLAQSDDERIALDASSRILDRNHGKPVQALQHQGADGGALQVSIAINRVVKEQA